MNTTLISLVGAADIPINRPILVIGRNADCDVVIDSKKVSRQHCCIASLQGKLLLRDLGSTNGVRVNGRRFEEVALCSGDEVTIGNLRYRVDSSIYKAAEDQARPRAEKPPVPQATLESSEQPIMLEEEDSDDGMGTEMADEDARNRYGAPPAKHDSSWLKLPDDVNLQPSSDDDIGIKKRK